MTLDKQMILSGAKKVFFEAMMDGYAGGNLKNSIKTTSGGYKTIEFQSNEFTVIDRYCVMPFSDKSAGTTTIFFKIFPVWWMSYGGFYPECVIPFLKLALRQSYEKGEFNGGRGPEVWFGDILTYTNFLETNDFSGFSGEEKIVCPQTGELLGLHKFWGMSLL